jgi:hypothetical protein
VHGIPQNLLGVRLEKDSKSLRPNWLDTHSSKFFGSRTGSALDVRGQAPRSLERAQLDEGFEATQRVGEELAAIVDREIPPT